MSTMYARGRESLAASMASSALEGIHSNAPEHDIPCADHVFKLSYTLKEGDQSILYIWVRAICNCFVRDSIEGLQTTALSKRGWAFQECFLSPRVLHFAGVQVLL